MDAHYLDSLLLGVGERLAARLHEPRQPLHLALEHLLLVLKQLLVNLVLIGRELGAVYIGA